MFEVIRFPNNADVAAENLSRLKKLRGNSRKYAAFDIPETNRDGVPFDAITIARAVEDSPAPSMLELKVHMLLGISRWKLTSSLDPGWGQGHAD